MALRAKKPTEIKKRLKTMFYGSAGVGKTTAAIQFPRPYLIDTERGAENDEYVRLLGQAGGVIFQSSDFDEVLDEVKSLLTEKHEYKTLIIDPITIIYNDLLDKSAISLASKEDPSGTAYNRHKYPADRKFKRLLNLLSRLDMNIIMTSHAKSEWKNGQSTGINTYDAYLKSDHLLDLLIEVQKRGKERIGVVRKTRLEEFPDGENFQFSYEIFAGKYGREMLERDAIAEVLATTEQVKQLNQLIDILKIDSEIKQKWLDKAESSTFEEMETNKIQAVIDMLNKKLTITT